MEENYFVISNSDGDTTVRPISKEQLLRDIENDEYPNIFSEFPNNSDTNYWSEGVLIIKGKMVVPKAVQVTTRYYIE